jgi:hypothetical protein
MTDGRYGKPRGTAVNDDDLSDRGDVTYSRAVMSDNLLCIACAESFVDIHDTLTGR